MKNWAPSLVLIFLTFVITGVFVTECYSKQTFDYTINLKAFEDYFKLSKNSIDVDSYVEMYSKQIINLTVNDLNALVSSNKGDLQKARALLMLTVLNLNINISDAKVSSNYYHIFYYDLKRQIWITLILK